MSALTIVQVVAFQFMRRDAIRYGIAEWQAEGFDIRVLDLTRLVYSFAGPKSKLLPDLGQTDYLYIANSHDDVRTYMAALAKPVIALFPVHRLPGQAV